MHPGTMFNYLGKLCFAAKTQKNPIFSPKTFRWVSWAHNTGDMERWECKERIERERKGKEELWI